MRRMIWLFSAMLFLVLTLQTSYATEEAPGVWPDYGCGSDHGLAYAPSHDTLFPDSSEYQFIPCGSDGDWNGNYTLVEDANDGDPNTPWEDTSLWVEGDPYGDPQEFQEDLWFETMDPNDVPVSGVQRIEVWLRAGTDSSHPPQMHVTLEDPCYTGTFENAVTDHDHPILPVGSGFYNACVTFFTPEGETWSFDHLKVSLDVVMPANSIHYIIPEMMVKLYTTRTPYIDHLLGVTGANLYCGNDRSGTLTNQIGDLESGAYDTFYLPDHKRHVIATDGKYLIGHADGNYDTTTTLYFTAGKTVYAYALVGRTMHMTINGVTSYGPGSPYLPPPPSWKTYNCGTVPQDGKVTVSLSHSGALPSFVTMIDKVWAE